MNEVYDSTSIDAVLDWNCISKDFTENGILYFWMARYITK
jgi:hypothetical protein